MEIKAARERELSNLAFKVLIQIFMAFMTWNVTQHETIANVSRIVN